MYVYTYIYTHAHTQRIAEPNLFQDNVSVCLFFFLTNCSIKCVLAKASISTELNG